MSAVLQDQDVPGGGPRPAGGGIRARTGGNGRGKERQRHTREAQLVLFPRKTAGRQETDVHAYSRPARAFTGDFWFTHRASDRLWFALGDVAGKGINAAVVMAMIQEELEHRIISCAQTRCDPSVTTQRLDAFLRPILPQNRFATTVIGHLTDDGTLMLANGGHGAALVLRASGAIERVGSTGPAVGILPSAQWCSKQVQLERGDSLVLYSDGLLEAKSSDGDEFGLSRIEAVLSRSFESAHAIVSALVQAVDVHADGHPDDDLTILAVRR